MPVDQQQNGLELFFSAQSVAVIGASNHREKVGFQVLNNLVRGIRGASPNSRAAKRKLYPVNPATSSILGLKCYRSVSEVLDPIDLVVIVTPVGTVLSLVDELIARNHTFKGSEKVKAVIIISAGFAETDTEGKILQQRILLKLAVAGIRLLGPNTLGLIHTGWRLNASFAQHDIPEGNLAVISQSGAMLTALFNALVSRQAGVSFAVSLGNKADLNENDCLEYALEDRQTSAVIMYIESFSHLPRFFELVSKVRRVKPVIILKGGTSSRGQVASSSHTAALATNQALLRAASLQFGFTLVDNMEELMNVSFFLAHHRTLPCNTMVITNAGGPAVNTIDELQHAGITLARWSRRAQDDLARLLPRIKAANPLDLLGDADPQRFKDALSVAQRDPEIESILIIVTPQAVTDIKGITDQVIANKGKKPIFVALMGGDQLEQYRQQLRANHIFSTGYANNIVEMLQVLTKASRGTYLPSRYALSEPHTPSQSQTRQAVSQLHQRLALQQGISKQFLVQPNMTETFGLLRKAGFRIPRHWIIRRASLNELGSLPYPLFVKTANLSILHKKKVGAVYGVVKDASEARKAFEQMIPFGNEVLFQEVLEIEDELLVGIENDPQFGMYMTVGLGGSYTNLLADRAYCFLPAPPSMIEKAWRQTKAAQLFAQNPAITQAVLEELARLQQFMMQHPWVRSIEINPLAVSQGHLWVADIKLQV
ncbi:acetate--CoA ligase family protein [Patescibacteria group bacterium]|nr:acetate--CoA ligase family protein [Patescibacteria group bacterium]